MGQAAQQKIAEAQAQQAMAEEGPLEPEQQATVSNKHKQFVDDHPTEDYGEFRDFTEDERLSAEPGYEPWEPPAEAGLLEKIKNKIASARAPSSEGVSGMREVVYEQKFQRRRTAELEAQNARRRVRKVVRTPHRRSLQTPYTSSGTRPPISVTGDDYRPCIPQTPVYGGMMGSLSTVNSFLRPDQNLPTRAPERVTVPLPSGPSTRVTLPLYVSSYQRPIDVDVGQSRLFRRSPHLIDTDIGQSRFSGAHNEQQEECEISKALGLRRRR